MSAAIAHDPEMVDALDHDGANYELANGRTVRLHISPDYDTTAWDFPDLYGRLGDVMQYRDAREPRPEWANGRARKVQVDRGAWCWWQPPVDVTTDDDVDMAYRAVRDAIEGGYVVMTITVHETVVDSLDHEHTVEVAGTSIGGVESTVDDGYRAELIADMLDELPDGVLS